MKNRKVDLYIDDQKWKAYIEYSGNYVLRIYSPEGWCAKWSFYFTETGAKIAMKKFSNTFKMFGGRIKHAPWKHLDNHVTLSAERS